jgi:hypothetical protein
VILSVSKNKDAPKSKGWEIHLFFFKCGPICRGKIHVHKWTSNFKNTKTIPPVLYKLKLMIQKYKTLDTFKHIRHISHLLGFFFQIPQAGPLARILNIS